jgi:hypothetical protein
MIGLCLRTGVTVSDQSSMNMHMLRDIYLVCSKWHIKWSSLVICDLHTNHIDVHVHPNVCQLLHIQTLSISIHILS